MKVRGQIHAPAAYSWENSPQYPLGWRLGGLWSQCGLQGEEKNLLPVLRIESRLLGHPAHILVAIPTELSWLMKMRGTAVILTYY
jgi:hypothetical protein